MVRENERLRRTERAALVSVTGTDTGAFAPSNDETPVSDGFRRDWDQQAHNSDTRLETKSIEIDT
ncbi:hypothetical protein SAMN05421752_10842 [Natronorubrum thiooxidans]|uniref:Uncharacterized protein n=1 Tax=Natronorubrum thiooxidans TaxID=308853 RepID=A0A1N7FSR5_9EURY|nr:hypothetical protein SAMN05421752_10842 [Natronorubrum thiooxidans]